MTVPVVRAEVELSYHAHLGWGEAGGRVHRGAHWIEAGSKSQLRGSSMSPFEFPQALTTAACRAGSFSLVRISRPWAPVFTSFSPRSYEAEKLGFDVARRSRQDAVEVLRVALCLDERLAAPAGAPVVEGVAGGLTVVGGDDRLGGLREGMFRRVPEAHPEGGVFLGPQGVAVPARVALVVEAGRCLTLGEVRFRVVRRGVLGASAIAARDRRVGDWDAAERPTALLQVHTGIVVDGQAELELLLRRDIARHGTDRGRSTTVGNLVPEQDDRRRVRNLAEVVAETA